MKLLSLLADCKALYSCEHPKRCFVRFAIRKPRSKGCHFESRGRTKQVSILCFWVIPTEAPMGACSGFYGTPVHGTLFVAAVLQDDASQFAATAAMKLHSFFSFFILWQKRKEKMCHNVPVSSLENNSCVNSPITFNSFFLYYYYYEVFVSPPLKSSRRPAAGAPVSGKCLSQSQNSRVILTY